MQPNFIIQQKNIFKNQFINNIKIFRIMKKYLMTGVAALAICAAFTSCSKSDELYNPEQIQQNEAAQIVEKYNQAFLKYIGASSEADIPANQTWGFGGYAAATRAAGTRANTEHANEEGNIWYLTYERPYNVNLSAEELAELKALLTKEPGTYNTPIRCYPRVERVRHEE